MCQCQLRCLLSMVSTGKLSVMQRDKTKYLPNSIACALVALDQASAHRPVVKSEYLIFVIVVKQGRRTCVCVCVCGRPV